MAQESFNGRLVLITGGSTGIGFSLAKMFVQEGAQVWLVSRRQEVLAEAQKNLLAISPKSSVGIFSADVTDVGQVQAAVDHIIREAGVPDYLINAAGESYADYVQNIPVETYHKIMDINYFGTVHMTIALLPHMLKRGSGHIVNISSAAGFLAPFGYLDYVPTKYAVRGFSDALRLELKPLGLRVSVVFPPATDTPGLTRENKTKPYETLAAFSSKVISPDVVAKATLKGLRKGQYTILPNFETSLYYSLVFLMGNAIYPIMDFMLADARKKKPSA
jgi:3-dehydrosphinganine reductase